MSTTVYDADLHFPENAAEFLDEMADAGFANYNPNNETYTISLPNGVDVYYDMKDKEVYIVA